MTRTRIAKFIVIFIFLFLFFDILYLGIINGRRFRELSNKNCVRLFPQEGSRGRIIDTQGRTIIDNELCYDLSLVSENAGQADRILKDVSGILGRNFNELKDVFRNNFIYSSALITIAKDIDVKSAIAIEELKPNLDGIIILPRPRRRYSHERLASHVIGYINEIDRWRLTKLADYGYKTKDIVGFGGVEEKYDYYLRQEEGGLSIEVDSRGKFVRALGFRPPKSGKDLQLTLDLKMQEIAEDGLAEKKGAVVIMDPYNGQILAMASSPNFSPAAFVNKDNTYLRDLFSDASSPLVNRAISSGYPAGSIFKLVVATAGLETGKIDLSTTFYCPGSMHVGKQKFSCWDTHHEENLIGAIAHSCNVFFYRTGLLLGPQTIHDWAVKFGFSKATSVNLPYEIDGVVPNPLWRRIYRLRNWFDGDTVNFSIGQGELLITPLQAVRMIAVFANGGFLVTPNIVKAVDGRDVSSYYQRTSPLRIKSSTLDSIRRGLRNAVEDVSGTASVLSTLSVSVAGKTGTAQAPPGLPHGWFVGYFPYKNPKFVICVFLERGGAGYYATLVAKQIIERLIREGLI